jgi:hypothetical protein
VDPTAKVSAADAEPLRVRKREELEQLADAAVPLGEAPDGLPLILDVERAAHLTESILEQLGQPTRLPPPVAAAMANLDGVLAQAARAAGVVDVRGTLIYRTAATVGELLGETLLVRALGGASPLAGDEPAVEPGAGRGQTAVLTAAAVAPVTLMKTPTAGQRHVAVPLRAGPGVLVEAGDTVEPETIAPLRLEDLRRIASARFVVRGRTTRAAEGLDSEGALADAEAYLAAARTGATLTWTVTVGDLGRIIAELARSVGALHEEGRVHADVKPANAVITTAGVFAIDPIGVVAGQASPGATPGWAAPEQLLSRPVLPATDVYPLGLMVARLLGAVVSGEERSFVVPLGRERRRVRLLSDHDVHIDPALELPAPIRAAWEALIRQAVEFDPDDRTGSTHELADRIDELIEAAPLDDLRTISPGPGRLEREVEIAGTIQPAWLVTDRRSPCS